MSSTLTLESSRCGCKEPSRWGSENSDIDLGKFQGVINSDLNSSSCGCKELSRLCLEISEIDLGKVQGIINSDFREFEVWL